MTRSIIIADNITAASTFAHDLVWWSRSTMHRWTWIIPDNPEVVEFFDDPIDLLNGTSPGARVYLAEGAPDSACWDVVKQFLDEKTFTLAGDPYGYWQAAPQVHRHAQGDAITGGTYAVDPARPGTDITAIGAGPGAGARPGLNFARPTDAMRAQMEQRLQQQLDAVMMYVLTGTNTPEPPVVTSDEMATYRPSPSRVCLTCHAVEPSDAPEHQCPAALSDIDLATVRRIQELAHIRRDWTPDEIGHQIGVVVAWRCWDRPGFNSINRPYGRLDANLIDPRAFTTPLPLEAMAHHSPWPVSRPLPAICEASNCRDLRSLGAPVPCQYDDAPRCRIHAAKSRDWIVHEYQNMGSSGRWQVERAIFGLVALWGEVIECEHGWLATRAYPLALEDRRFADLYKVPYIQPPKE